MDLRELESYRLSDAVKFNDKLNPRLWGSDEHLLPDVREKLMAIADDFREFLGITDLEIKDITISGSNAAYTYTPHSDIDLHLVVDLPKADESDIYRELFDAKKYQYNDQHDYKIGNYDIELYVQDANKKHHSQGIYSLLNNDWVKVPSRRQPEVDDISVKSKYEDLGHRIEAAINSGDLERMDAMAQKIKELRQSGLDTTGEFGPENLAFKILRTNGTLQKLRDARKTAKDQEMSLAEQEKDQQKKKSRWGEFGGMWFPGFGYYTSDSSENPETFDDQVEESVDKQDPKSVIDIFTEFCIDFLGIKDPPKIRIKRDPAWSQRNSTFGRYDPDTHSIFLSLSNRHIVDILRTLAHELTHAWQAETEPLPPDSGDTGSPWENQANAKAGEIMRHWADKHPGMFKDQPLHEDGLDKPTPTAQEIMRKHGINERQLIDQLKKGIAVELEHTNDIQVALEIARDHLWEFPDYYTRLVKVEKNIDEGIKEKIAAAAAAACIAGAPGCATTSDAIRDVQTVGRTAQTFKGMSSSDAREELTTALKDYLRRGSGTRESRVNEASGYIPTAAEKDDPRFKMALTADVHPGQTGKEANKLGLQTDAQGRPELLMKRLGNLLESVKAGEELITEDEDLFEVKMSPTSLEAWAKSPEAEGIQAGFEAEMIFRDTQREDHDGDMEPDYDPDTRPDDIDDVINFFSYDEYGYGLSPRAAGRVRDGLYEEYHTWMDEAIEDEWRNVVDEQVEDYMNMNVWEDDQDQYRERAAEELGIETSEESAEQSEKIEARARELFDEDVQQEIEDRGRYYDEARDYFSDMMRDSGDYDEGEFLRSQYGYMSDISNAYNLDWPYYYGGQDNGGGRTPEDIADSLRGVVDGEVKVGSGYHGVTRKPNRWIIEPDGSLDPDDHEDAGLEIVSPPMPLPKALEQLQKVIDWGNDEADAYTNSSTGLHMGVSIPHKGGDVDYVKLILFMGDQYVLDKFGRASNTYCRSALEKLKSRVSSARERGELDEAAGQAKMGDALELIKKNLIELAHRYVQGDVGTGKYTSAHIKPGYIEFRSPGGDYLSMADRGEYDDIKNTMLRFARAMQIAGRPDLERKEYAKKLTKLLTQDGKSDSLRLFSDYVSGKINQEELKKQWAAEVLRKEQPAAGGMKEYEVVIDGTGEVIDTLRARNDVDADAQFRTRYRDDPRWFQMDLREKGNEYEIVNDRGEVIDTIKGGSIRYADELARQKYAGQGFDFSVREKPAAEPEKKPSRRAQIAKKIAERPTVWHVEKVRTGRVVLVAAKTVEGAKMQASRRDPEFSDCPIDPQGFTVKPATAAETQQYQQQQKDDAQDSQDIEQKLTGGQGRYRVSWTERRDGQWVADSLNIDAASAEAAVDNVRTALSAAGRTPSNIVADPANDTPWRAPRQTTRQQEYQIYNPETNIPIVAFMAASDAAAYERIEQYRQQHPSIRVALRNAPVPGSTMDLAQQRAAQTQSGRRNVEIYNPRTGRVVSTAYDVSEAEIQARIQEWERELGVGAGLLQARPLTRTAEQPRSSIYNNQFTGRWLVKDRQGNTVYTFGGVGNNQEDANRTAHTWLLSQGDRFDDQGPFDVVPEMDRN